MKTSSLLDRLFKPQGLSTRFQPIWEMGGQGGGQDGRIHALECLSRGPQGTNIESADVLFEYVRCRGAEMAIDRLCIATAMARFATLADAGSLRFNLHLNVHATTLRSDADFVSFLRQQAESRAIPLTRLAIEIIEHGPFWDSPSFHRAFAALRDLGLRIALDDVGRGESNFRMILACQPDYLKADALLVKGIDGDAHRRAVLESLLWLAEKLGSRVVAKGVEDEADLATLMTLGASLFQGFYLGRPMTGEELQKSLLCQQNGSRPSFPSTPHRTPKESRIDA